GQSQFVPRGSAAPASEGADSESTQVLTTATGTVLPGTSATSGTAGSGEGPVASSKDLRSPVQVPSPGLQRAINYFQGQLGLPANDGSAFVPPKPKRKMQPGVRRLHYRRRLFGTTEVPRKG
ncbi:hypothetical protein L917_08847, partial [Phytophthora nicotianae]